MIYEYNEEKGQLTQTSNFDGEDFHAKLKDFGVDDVVVIRKRGKLSLETKSTLTTTQKTQIINYLKDRKSVV